MTGRSEFFTGLLMLCAFGAAGYAVGTARERAEWLAVPPSCFNLRLTVEGAGVLTADGAKMELGQ